MWPIIIILAVCAILLSLFIGTKLKDSRKFGTIVEHITEEQDLTPQTTEGVIKDISAAEKALQAKAKAQKIEADKLQKDSVKIGDYLADKGVVKSAKGKETNSKGD